MESQTFQKKSKPRELKPYKQFLRYSGLGFQMMTTIGVAGWLGYLLDSYFNTLPLFLVLFILGSFIGIIVLLIRSTRNNLP